MFGSNAAQFRAAPLHIGPLRKPGKHPLNECAGWNHTLQHGFQEFERAWFQHCMLWNSVTELASKSIKLAIVATEQGPHAILLLTQAHLWIDQRLQCPRVLLERVNKLSPQLAHNQAQSATRDSQPFLVPRKNRAKGQITGSQPMPAGR